MSVQNLPLLELFTRLRTAGLPLGIDEYQLVLRALRGGFGISDRAALRRLCRTLWVKSADDGRLFDYHFAKVMSELDQSEASSQPLESLSERSEAHTPDMLPTTGPDATGTSEITVRAEDEIQVARAVLRTASIDDELPISHYISSDEYFPVTRRQMKQSWRYLRRPLREGPPVELDVEATVNEIARKGMLLEPVLVPRRINRAELLLLIDHGGSMVPFHILSHRLMETVLRGGRLGKANIYYFHNCPMEHLYRDSAHQEYERVEEMLNGLPQRTGVFVFSDAGAARGGFNPDRVNLTREFLAKFRPHFRYIVWLNPMPRSRWLGTTAGEVRWSVPMFDLSRRGLEDAISVLRGRPSHFVHPVRYRYSD